MKKSSFWMAMLSLLLMAAVLFLPIIRFSSALYTKRSPNTFVGDEKYQEVRAEVEETLAEYRQQGIDAELGEQVIERVNSKGATTSLVVFTVEKNDTRNGWQLMSAGISSSTILQVICALMLLGALMTAVCAFAGEARRKSVGPLAIAAVLLALLLIPAVYLTLNLNLSRRIDLHLAGNEVPGIAELLAKLDAFLFDGKAGEGLEGMLGSMTCAVQPAVLFMVLPAFLGLCAAILGSGRLLGKTLLRMLLYLSVILFSIFILYPFIVMFITAFRSNAETTDMYFLHVLPVKWLFSNLKDTLDRGVLRYLLNSVLIAGGATCIAMLCGIPAAYAMARMNFRGRKAYLGFVIMSQMFSPVVLLVGISRLMNTIGLNDTIWGLMFINAAFNQAFAIWLLRGTFVSISSEMEQAACIDGTSVIGALIRILLPMAAPGIVTTLIFVFINSWNEYTVSTVLISTPANKPITVGITQFSSFNMIEWQYLFAAALLATVPVVILFMLIEKHLAAGLTAGGVKG